MSIRVFIIGLSAFAGQYDWRQNSIRGPPSRQTNRSTSLYLKKYYSAAKRVQSVHHEKSTGEHSACIERESPSPSIYYTADVKPRFRVKYRVWQLCTPGRFLSMSSALCLPAACMTVAVYGHWRWLVFCNVPPCSLAEVYRRIRYAYYPRRRPTSFTSTDESTRFRNPK